MKLLVLNLVAIVSFTAPALAAAKPKCVPPKTVQEKNLTDLKSVIGSVGHERDYRIHPQNDMSSSNSEFNAGIKIGNGVLGPTAGTDRRWIMTPDEKFREDICKSPDRPEGCKGLTFTGSERRPRFIGAKYTEKLGSSAGQ